MAQKLDQVGIAELVNISARYAEMTEALMGCQSDVLRGLGNALVAYRDAQLTSEQLTQLESVSTSLTSKRTELDNVGNNEYVASKIAELGADVAKIVAYLDVQRSRLTKLPGEITVCLQEQAELNDVKATAGVKAYAKTVGKLIRVGGGGQGIRTDTANKVAKRTMNGTEYYTACLSHKEWYAYSYTEADGFKAIYDYQELPGVPLASPSAVNRVLKLYAHGYKAKDGTVYEPGIATANTILAKPRKNYPIYSSGSAGVTFLDQKADAWLEYVTNAIAQHGIAQEAELDIAQA